MSFCPPAGGSGRHPLTSLGRQVSTSSGRQLNNLTIQQFNKPANKKNYEKKISKFYIINKLTNKKTMKKRTQKKIAKIIAVILAVAMNLTAALPLHAAARLTSISDAMSSNKISGTGSAVAGYTQSTAAVTDGFVFVTGSNEIICLDTDGTLGADTTCTNTVNVGEVKVSLITHGLLTSGNVYTGDQVATAIKTGLEAQDGDADDSYTVSYNESTDLFTVRGDGGNTLNPAIGWALYAGADKAAATLGYTTNDTAVRDADKTSDSAVAFNVVAGSNNVFTIQVDGTNSGNITITAGVYTAATLFAQMDTQITADAALTAAGKTVTVSYASDKFKITSDSTGGGSTIRVTEGATDFLKTVSLVGDVPIDGEVSSGIVSANHTIAFTTTTAVAAGGKIVITFPAGFSIPTDLEFSDIDMSANGGGERTLAAAADGTHDGVVRTSATVITFTLGTTATNINAGGGEVSGNIAAGTIITIEIGRNATAGATGVEQIPNPTTVGLYKTEVKTTTSGDATIDDAYAAVYLVSDNSVTVTATVDPLLSFALYGGNNIDFGTLEPNAYHKLGGARNAYGSITLTNVTVDDVLDAEMVTVRGIIYEFSDDGVIASTSQAKVDIVDNGGSYLTIAQVASNLARAINNYDGDLVRANVNPSVTDVVYVMATQPGTGANSWTITESVTDVDIAVSGFANGLAGYNKKATAVTYAAGSDVGNGSTGTNLVVSTNGAGGYVLTVQNTDTNGATDGADGLTNGATEIEEWTTGTFGYGLLASSQSARYGDATDNIIAANFKGDGTGDLPEAMSTTAATIASYSGATAGDNIAIEYNVRIDASQAAGSYYDTITYIFTATF